MSKVWGFEKDDNGYVYFFDESSDTTSFAWDSFRIKLLQSPDGARYFAASGNVFGTYADVLHKHTIADVKIVPQHTDGLPEVIMKCAIFACRQGPGHVWVSAASLCTACGINCDGKDVSSSWYLDRVDKGTWDRWIAKHSLTTEAYRNSRPIASATAQSAKRCLNFNSLHLSLVLVQATRAAYAKNSQMGLVQSDNQQRAFGRIVGGILSHISEDTILSLRVDVDAHRVGSFIFGSFPGSLVLCQSAVYITTLNDALDSAIDHALGRMRKSFVAAVDSIKALNGFSLKDFFVHLACLTFPTNAHPLNISLFNQVLWLIVDAVEFKFLQHVPARNHVGALVKGTVSSDVVDVLAFRMYQADDPYGTATQLCKYITATDALINCTDHIAICGPDSSKVGTDLGLMVGAIMNCETSVTAWCRPQVIYCNRVITFWEVCMHMYMFIYCILHIVYCFQYCLLYIVPTIAHCICILHILYCFHYHLLYIASTIVYVHCILLIVYVHLLHNAYRFVLPIVYCLLPVAYRPLNITWLLVPTPLASPPPIHPSPPPPCPSNIWE